MAIAQIIPRVLPSTLGRADGNGDRARFTAPSAMEQGAQHVAFTRRGVISGWLGKREADSSTDQIWHGQFWREQYATQLAAAVVYSTSSGLVTAQLEVLTPLATITEIVAGSAANNAAAANIARVVGKAGNTAEADAGAKTFSVEVSDVQSSDLEEADPTVTIWSVRVFLLPLFAVELT